MFSTPADDAITLHYQPLADCGGRAVGLEALMRWHHRQRGRISPEAFIPIFEESGLMLPLSSWALRQACLDAASWKTSLRVAVNVSPLQLLDGDFPAQVAAAVAETGLAPERLEIEVTEASLIASPDRAREVMERLRSLGIGIALDDFGTGRSSPAFITEFPFSKVKIDESVVAAVGGPGSDAASARSVIHMVIQLAHSLEMIASAEGVEAAAQLAFLKEEDCDLVQGFLIGRPAPIASYADLIGGDRVASSTFPGVPGPADRPAGDTYGRPGQWFDQLNSGH